MSKKIIKRLPAIFLVLLVSFVSVPSQKPAGNLNRERTYDVQHYIIRTSFDRKNKIVFGDTTVSLKPLSDNFRTLELDAVGMKFDFIKLEPEQTDLRYRQAGEKITITLDKPYQSSDLISVRFKYSAQPKKGITFVDALTEKGKVVRDAQIWTQGEPEEAHHWFPSYDFPDDKATSEQIITVNKGETVIANGKLVERRENNDGTVTFHYKMPVPYSTYLTSFVVGKYVKISDSYRDIPLGYYVYPGTESIVSPAYGKTKEMFRIFEELTGVPYPFNKYDQTMVASFTFGGMENITATTMADTEILFARSNQVAVEDLVAHELAHSWFGNLVTCRNWGELWLNEGFATFFEAVFHEHVYGRESYIRKVQDDAEAFFIDNATNRRRHGLFNGSAKPDDSIFNTTTYQKGGVVLHMLRETIGDKEFWKGVNIYLNRHKFGNVETPDLQKAMEEASGKDLEKFFEQWVYGAGHPRLEVRQVYAPAAKKLNLYFSQVQKVDSITPAAFAFPVDVEIHNGKEVVRQRLEIKNRNQNFSIAVGEKPSKIVFDKEVKIPLAMIKTLPLTIVGKQNRAKKNR